MTDHTLFIYVCAQDLEGGNVIESIPFAVRRTFKLSNFQTFKISDSSFQLYDSSRISTYDGTGYCLPFQSQRFECINVWTFVNVWMSECLKFRKFECLKTTGDHRYLRAARVGSTHLYGSHFERAAFQNPAWNPGNLSNRFTHTYISIYMNLQTSGRHTLVWPISTVPILSGQPFKIQPEIQVISNI
jgi:hypothetical protein